MAIPFPSQALRAGDSENIRTSGFCPPTPPPRGRAIPTPAFSSLVPCVPKVTHSSSRVQDCFPRRGAGWAVNGPPPWRGASGSSMSHSSRAPHCDCKAVSGSSDPGPCLVQTMEKYAPAGFCPYPRLCPPLFPQPRTPSPDPLPLLPEDFQVR